MKKVLLFIFALISINLFSQIQVKENSFRKIDGYVMLDKTERLDDNDNPMALIRITTENMTAEQRARFEFRGNAITYFDWDIKPGEFDLYISSVATFVEIIHPDYGKTEYHFPFDLCEFCGYEMVVQYVPLVSELEYGFLAISSEPSVADIYIDGKYYGKTNNVITDIVAGNHELKLEKEGYVTVTKTIVITKGETLKVNETLQTVSSQKAHLIVRADQENAMIYIDDELLGVKEASRIFKFGTTHTWMIKCNMYHTESGSVTLNERTVIDKKLRPNYGFLNISTTPEQGAMVFVDEEYVGLSPVKTDKLKSGSHNVRVMKDMYKMKEQSFVVNDGMTTNASLNMSANFVNVTVTTDSQSDIYVDDKYKGKGRWTGRLSDGIHTFEARKENHKASNKNLELVLGETKTITLDAPKPINGSFEINSSPMGADIYIDGKHYGETPNYISEILIGEHELKLSKQGCAELKKTIVVKEGETLSVNEKLQTYQNTPIGLCVKEGSFRKLEGYIMLDKSEHIDDNNNPMALIKITTENISAEERTRFTYKGNIETFFDVQQQEDGQLYLYISAVAPFVEIIHPDYGKTEYAFPFELCDFCGYEMVVQYESNCKDQYSNIAGTVEFATNIAFESGKATLTRDSYQYLDQLVQIMRADENCWVKLDGHTDNTYGDNINQRLSLDRAVAIEDYLVENGIGPDRIIARGHGSNKPIADNKTAEGRAKNRRVEVNIAR